MKIVALSDIHNRKINKLDIPKGDVLILAGDYDLKHPIDAEILINNLNDLKFKNILLVPGNHDWAFVYQNIQDRGNVHILIDKEITINGYKFYGTPWMPKFSNWAFMKSEEELVEIYDKIPTDIDVLITHGPPYGILDKNDIGDNCGSTALKEWFVKNYKKTKGIYHFFGHIHRELGEDRIIRKGKHCFFNCSLLNEQYERVNEPIEVEI